MSALLIFVAGGLLTFAMRLSFIYLLGRTAPPETVRRLLRLVPAAVLAAIITPELLLHMGRPSLDLGNTRLIAGLAAVLVSWRTKNTLLTILVGFGVLLVLELFR